jgi:hypothetical protein
MAVGKIRVYRLARELGLQPQLVLDIARRLGYKVISQLSWLDAEQRVAVVEALAQLPPVAPAEPPAVGPCATAHRKLLRGRCPWCGRTITNGQG